MSDWSAAEGSPVPLGATWIESARRGTSRCIPSTRKALPCCSMRKRTWSLPSSLTPSTTSATSQAGFGTAGSRVATSAALASTPTR